VSYHSEYKKIIEATLKQTPVLNKRTGEKIYQFPRVATLIHKKNSIPIIGGRKVFLKSAAAEVAWYLSGIKDCQELNTFTSMWKPWQQDNKVEAAYGHRWINYFGIDQIQTAIENLTKDNSSRRIWVNTWAPKEDTNPEMLNVPCPVGFNLNIINNKLNMQVVMRSSDLAIGLIYDTISFRLLQQIISSTLKKPVGDIEFVLLNAHLYASHEPVVSTLLKDGMLDLELNLNFANAFCIDTLKNKTKEYVLDYQNRQSQLHAEHLDIKVLV
jgi:thymidylate synthase